MEARNLVEELAVNHYCISFKVEIILNEPWEIDSFFFAKRTGVAVKES